MEQDARSVRDGSRIAADVCIIGSGPAGITIARELAGTDLDVLVLESGGPERNERAQDLNAGSVMGDAYADLRATRYRARGGTARIWNTPVLDEPGAKYVPLDAVDFEERPGVALSGWPFDRAHLEPFYHRAQTACGLGSFSYEAPVPGLALAGGALTSRIYQLGGARGFTGNLDRHAARDNVRVLLHATACALVTARRRVERVRVACLAGSRFDVQARVFVLAAGAIENARLLLVSELDGHGRPNWVGRGFMEHPRDWALRWTPRSPDLFHEAAFYDVHRTAGGTIAVGRLALTGDAVRGHGLNATIMLRPTLRRPPAPSGVTARVLDRLRGLARRPAPEGFGWSDSADAPAIYDAFNLVTHLEQRPRAENRIALGTARDALGVPRVVLHWRWREDEQAMLERLRHVIASCLEDAGLGRVELRSGLRPDPNAHHHAGTTRMHADARHGVADSDGRVHGMDNLYVTGASVFPTAGFANPTLTIVALALRLGDHLKQSL